ncbi:MAG: ribH, partial [Dehalococcoidia bacterium]|nr:ribH [Dehalococcoidia bacterium]
MSLEHSGSHAGEGLHFAIVVSRFNELITKRLLAGARDALAKHGVLEQNVDVAWVPGALEIPLVAKRMAETGRYAGVICLGAVIRGETGHYEYVASNASAGAARVALDTNVPVLFGILTTENMDQALARAGSKGGNKGFDTAMAAIEMANLLKDIGER